MADDPILMIAIAVPTAIHVPISILLTIRRALILAILVGSARHGAARADAGVVRRRVAVAQVCGLGVLGQRAVRVDAGALALVAADAEETKRALLAVARGVPVGGAWAEALLLAAVAHKGQLEEGGEDKEEPMVKLRISLLSSDIRPKNENSHSTNCNTQTRRLHLTSLPKTRQSAHTVPVRPIDHVRARITRTIGCSHLAVARTGAVPVRGRDVDESAGEADI